jgi:hypothetical protein
MKRVLIAGVAWLIGCAAAMAQATGPIYCNRSVLYTSASTGAQQVIAATNNQAIYFCGFTIVGGATGTTQLSYGTGTNCGTGNSPITPTYSVVSGTLIADAPANFRGLLAPAGSAACINNSVASDAAWILYYAQQ